MAGEDEAGQGMREMAGKILLTVVAVVLWAAGMQIPAGDAAGTMVSHAGYMVSHANVWHLAGNLFVLWMFRGRLFLIPSLVIAFVASYLPACESVWEAFVPVGATMGLSGVLFAIAGIKWGAACRNAIATHGTTAGKKLLRTFALRVVPFALLGMVVPHVNWCLHSWCLGIGFAAGVMIPAGEAAGTAAKRRG